MVQMATISPYYNFIQYGQRFKTPCSTYIFSFFLIIILFFNLFIFFLYLCIAFSFVICFLLIYLFLFMI